MPRSDSSNLDRLEALRFSFGPDSARRKLELLERLAESDFELADEVARLHDQLCFMRAYPDSRRLLDRVESMLAVFAKRPDLQLHRDELVNSGIQGTEIRFRFYWFTLCWLDEHWGGQLRIDWQAFPSRQRELLDRRLTMLMPYNETLALEEEAMPTRDWIERLKGPEETDARFVVGRFRAMRADPLPRESIFEEIDIPFRLLPGTDTPNTTVGRFAPSPVVFQKIPPTRSRETFHRELSRKPRVRSAPRGQARELIEMARTLMVARERDLDSFVHADERDVRILDYPEGVQFVCFGAKPARRQMLDAAYGFLMLRNGVTIGYILSAALFGSAEVAFNVSPTFRGAEAAHLYGRSLGMVRQLFGADSFVVDPYQMGHGNPEGLRSGAWWFYYKLGFRPRDPKIARAAELEQEKVRSQKGYRTSIAKLDRLSSVNMYLQLGKTRDDVIGEFARENVGMRIVDYVAARFGADRERGTRVCSREAGKLLNVRPDRLSADERMWWERWAPLVLQLGADRWSATERKALGEVIRAKAGRRESDFVRKFDRHRRLRQAVFELSR